MVQLVYGPRTRLHSIPVNIRSQIFSPLLFTESSIPHISSVAITSSNRWFNIEKARRVLGYEPQVGLEEGIKRGVKVRTIAVAGEAPDK